MPKYKFTRIILTPEEILKAIGREDIPSTEVEVFIAGDDVEIDFGTHVLTETDEEKLKKVLKAMGRKFVGKEE